MTKNLTCDMHVLLTYLEIANSYGKTFIVKYYTVM